MPGRIKTTVNFQLDKYITYSVNILQLLENNTPQVFQHYSDTAQERNPIFCSLFYTTNNKDTLKWRTMHLPFKYPVVFSNT